MEKINGLKLNYEISPLFT